MGENGAEKSSQTRVHIKTLKSYYLPHPSIAMTTRIGSCKPLLGDAIT